MEKEIIDITNEDEVLNEVNNHTKALVSGLRAIALDFGFHIKASNSNDKINDYKHSVQYRLFSVRFHFHLLNMHINQIQSKHQGLIKKMEGPLYLNHLERDRREVSALLDSIVFHSYSMFDYLGSLIQHIITREQNNFDWQNIQRAASNAKNTKSFNTPEGDMVAETIKNVHSNFVNYLDRYRNHLIHNVADVCSYNHEWNVFSTEVKVYFICTRVQHKFFKRFGNSNNNYTISYFAKYLMIEAIQAAAKVIASLKNFMESISIKDEIANHPEKGIVYFDADGKPIQLSLPYWKEFEKHFIPLINK